MNENMPFGWDTSKNSADSLEALYNSLVDDKTDEAGLRIVVYPGIERPSGRIDYGLKLIERLDAYQHHVVGIILEENDPIEIYPEISFKERIKYPPFMCDKINRVKHNIQSEAYRDHFEKLQHEIKELQPDLGIVFLGRWVPPEIFSIPKYGFINYHPGPLPYLRGMEPDTFAILEGWQSIWGCVHKVNVNFDRGDILMTTPEIEINKYATPITVLHDLTAAGIELLHNTVHTISDHKESSRKQHKESGSTATLKQAIAKSYIDWNDETSITLERKLRAYCGQDIGLRLKVHHKDSYYTVHDVELYQGDFPGKPGDIIAYYAARGKFLLQPIFRILDGVAIILTGDAIKNPGVIPESTYLTEWIIPPRQRKSSTNFEKLKKSIEIFSNQGQGLPI